MTRLEHLRLAVALAHSTPGAQLRLRCQTGDTIAVGDHPAADIDPCEMRRVAAIGIRDRQLDHLERIAEIEYAGTLEDLGGGVLAVHRRNAECRAVPTFLAPPRLAEQFGDLDDVQHTDVVATIRPDGALGVSVIELSAPAGRFGEVDDLAARVAVMCFVDEVMSLARRELRRS